MSICGTVCALWESMDFSLSTSLRFSEGLNSPGKRSERQSLRQQRFVVPIDLTKSEYVLASTVWQGVPELQTISLLLLCYG